MPDKEYYEMGAEGFHEAYKKNDLGSEYLNFSRFIQGVFISKNGWVIDTGNYQDVNRELIELIKDRIEKHPLLWRLFFMVA